MRTILIQTDVKGADKFREILSSEISDFLISSSIEEVNLEEVEVVILWLNVPNYLSKLPNLKLLLICGSGIDHMIGSTELPNNIPLIRLVDPFLRNHVSNYVFEHICKHFFPTLNYHNHEGDWSKTLETIKKPKIGIMGLGLIGESMAEKFVNMGFEVCGWVRTSRHRTIKEVYVGVERLGDFAENSEVIVCQLPLTRETRGILNCHLFDLLPEEAYLINVGRGAHLIEADLLVALESGKLSGACLDVFDVEPLPSEHPFHTHPKIMVTPHIAGYVGPETQAPYAAQIIDRYYRNEKITGMVDYQTYY